MNNKIEVLGQVFTKEENVFQILSLIKNKGLILEPSCGNEAILGKVIANSKNLGLSEENIFGIEFDKSIKNSNCVIKGDFFKVIEDNFKDTQFDTIIGNPPYVRYQDILLETKNLLNKEIFDERSNLYLFFIHQCILKLKNKGELIFLVPRDFFKATSAKKLNNFLFEEGTITDLLDFGDLILFDGFSPNCIIFRFEKGNFNRNVNITNFSKEKTVKTISTFNCIEGQLLFTEEKLTVPLKDIFNVRVGAVSGADSIFENKNGNLDMVCSKTAKTGKLKTVFYNIESDILKKHKPLLLSRKIKKFNEKNWFHWGRAYFYSENKRIYVNAKTRNISPFFINECKAFDGSVLALILNKNLSDELVKDLKDDLNKLDWRELGFLCGNRFLFTQNSLQNLMLPDRFKKYL